MKKRILLAITLQRFAIAIAFSQVSSLKQRVLLSYFNMNLPQLLFIHFARGI